MNTNFHILTTVIKVIKNYIFQRSLTSHETNWMLLFLVFFIGTTQNQSRSIKLPAVEQRQDQDEVRHVWSIGVISFELREIQMWTQVIWKHFTKKCPNMVDFPDFHLVSFNLMLDWRAMTVTVYLAQCCGGHSLSVQWYD